MNDETDHILTSIDDFNCCRKCGLYWSLMIEDDPGCLWQEMKSFLLEDKDDE